MTYGNGAKAWGGRSWVVAAAVFAVVTACLVGATRRVGAAPIAVIDGEALDMSANRLDVDVERGTALLQGNVSASFGDLDIRCPSVEIRYDRSPRVSYARGTGGVTVRV